MEKYVVSARKYRPIKFEDVVGQSHVTTTLENAIKNEKVAQSILFCGPRGVGKTTCASGKLNILISIELFFT